MSGPPIAEVPAALTAAWLTDALRASGMLGTDRRVTEVDHGAVGTGQMSDALRLHLHYGGATDAPATMIAKLPAADPTSRQTALALGNYENEVRFYQELAPGLAVRTPQVYYADIVAETGSFILLLEDLAPGRPGDQLAGCSVDVARLAVAELVKLHAPRWGDPGLAEKAWLHRDRAANRAFLLGLLPDLWVGFRARYGSELGTEVNEAGEAIFGLLEPYLGADTEPWTITHGDYRLDNLLFDPTPGGTPVAVVDWQTCAHGPALPDVAYFLGAGLDAEHRREAERELVGSYHDGLVAAGVAGYDASRCWRDYRRGAWAGLIMAVAASMIVERTARGDQMFLTMARRHAVHALDLDSAAAVA